MTTTREVKHLVLANSAMQARAAAVKLYGIDQRVTKVTATKVRHGRYWVRWEATR